VPSTEVRSREHVEQIARSVFVQHGLAVTTIQVRATDTGWEIRAVRPDPHEPLVVSVFHGSAAQVRERVRAQVERLL
jgi:hypothetical protein